MAMRESPDVVTPAFHRPGLKVTGPRLFLILTPFLLFFTHIGLFFEGWRSFMAFLLGTLTGETTTTPPLNAGLVELWTASVFLTAWMALAAIVVVSRRPSGQPSTTIGFFARRMRDVFSANAWARRSGVFLLALCASVFLCPFLAPMDPYHQQDIGVTRYRPPLSKVTYLKWRPQASPAKHSGHTFRRHPPRLYVDSYRFDADSVTYQKGRETGTISRAQLEGVTEEDAVGSQLFLLGTDQFGRDILSRIIYGARISVLVATVAVVVAVSLGLLIGTVAGYTGGWTETILMRLTDLMLAFPVLFLILLVVGVVGPSLIVLMVVLGLTGWMGVARLVRGQVLSIREQTFIQKARAFGLPRRRIIWVHLVPNVLATVLVATTLRIGSTILVEASLSFLGLGVQPPTASWGNMIAEGRQNITMAWWVSTCPGIFLTTTVVAFNFLGDALRDALDPRLHESAVAPERSYHGVAGTQRF